MIHGLDSIYASPAFRAKDREKARIYKSIFEEPAISRKQLAEELRIRPTTISHVVQELLEDGLIEEMNAKKSDSAGRPEIQLHVIYNKYTAMSYYMVSRQLESVLVNLKGEVLFKKEMPQTKQSGQIELIDAVAESYREAKERTDTDMEVLGAGFSLPGVLVRSQTELIWNIPPRWGSYYSVGSKQLEAIFCKPLFMLHNVDAEMSYLLSTYAEYREQTVLLLHWGYGISASVARNTEILTSKGNISAEIGHWIMDKRSKKPCICGRQGCLETESALWALLPALRGEYPSIPEEEDLFADFIKRKPLDELPALQNAAEYGAIAIENLYKTFFPDHILLYGPVPEHPEVLELIRNRMKKELGFFISPLLHIDFFPALPDHEIAGSTGPLFVRQLAKDLVARW